MASSESDAESARNVDAEAPRHAFDRSLATRHAYLGDVEDVEAGGSLLDEGHVCRLPVFAIPGVVLLPGATLPLRLITRDSIAVAQAALAAPPSHAGLLVVACGDGAVCEPGSVVCTAELRQAKALADGTLNCLALGRQRCAVERLLGSSWVRVRVQAQEPLLRVPREARDGCAAWPAWAYRPFDAHHLERLLRTAYARLAPEVAVPVCGPAQLSWWLAANMPLRCRTRRELLQLPCAAQRLRRLLQLAAAMRCPLRCRRCGSNVAQARDLFCMSEAGSGSAFVNAHGYTHDLLTLRRVRGFRLEGGRESEHSWFPGFQWTLAFCKTCHLQLGWLFTAEQPGLEPPAFWGVRSQAVVQGELQPGDSDAEF